MHNVLVVDDEESVRQLLRDCLELDGYEVREAADAVQAIDRISEDIPDCIVLDVMMPGTSGLELLERLRGDPLTAGVPVLMLTAATDDETTWTGWSHGASYYVPKPFDIEHLLSWVERLCASAPSSHVGADVYDIDVPSDGPLAPLAELAPGGPKWATPPASAAGSSSRSEFDALAELTELYADVAPEPQEWAAAHEGPQVMELVHALDTGQFWVAYQPIIALDTHQVIGVEALARWAHPHRGDLAPSDFLPLAERHGLAGRVDDAVVLEAVQQVSAWNAARSAAGLEDLTLALNVSPDRVAIHGFCTDLGLLLTAHGLPAECVVLELNEVALMRLLASDGAAQGFQDLGVRLAFDDFTAASTSLNFLQRFRVDIVKVDRSFVRRLGVEDDDGDTSTVAAIISIAHRLGRAVIAEGVETPEQAARLRQLGCEYAQGFHFGFPASAAQLAGRAVGRQLTPGEAPRVVSATGHRPG